MWPARPRQQIRLPPPVQRRRRGEEAGLVASLGGAKVPSTQLAHINKQEQARPKHDTGARHRGDDNRRGLPVLVASAHQVVAMISGGAVFLVWCAAPPQQSGYSEP